MGCRRDRAGAGGIVASLVPRVIAGCFAACLVANTAEACTRGVFMTDSGTVITLRSMDWKGDIGSNLWVLPRGMAWDGAAGPDSIAGTSTYGSVVVTAFDAGAAPTG